MTSGIHGDVALKAKLTATFAKMEAVSPAAEEAGATMVARSIASYAPVKTGALLASVGVEGSSATVAAGHAPFVQYGTTHRAPNPFMTDGARAAEGQVTAAITAVMKAAIRTEV